MVDSFLALALLPELVSAFLPAIRARWRRHDISLGLWHWHVLEHPVGMGRRSAWGGSEVPFDSSLIRQLIRERWQQGQPRPSITQQLGGHPETFLDTLPAGSAERQQRRRLLGQHLQKRRTERI